MLLRIKAAVLATAGLVVAMPLTAEAESIITLGEVIVQAGEDTLAERRQAPNAKLVFDRKRIERFGDRTVGEVMRRLPGVVFGGPPGESKDVRLRGLDKEYTQILINGRRAPGGGEKREFQLDRLPADLIERIEIIRTPTADMDAQGIAGTINIILRETPNKRVFNATLGMSRLDGADTRPQGSLTYGDRIGDFGYLLALNAQQRQVSRDKEKSSFKADGAADKSERENELKDFEELNFAPRFRWQRSAQDVLRLEPLLLSSSEDRNRERLKFKADGSSDGRETDNEKKDRDQQALLGAWEHRFDNGGSLTLSLSANENREDKDNSKQFFKANGDLDKTQRDSDNKVDREYLANVTTTWLLGEQHTLKAGLEFSDKDRNKRKRKTETKNGVQTDTTNPKDNYTLEERRINAFVQDGYAWSERHLLTAGVRMEWTQNDSATDIETAERQRDAQWLPSLNYLFQWSERTNLRAGVARTVRRPKFDELAPSVESKDGTLSKPDKVGNPELKPEAAVGVDAGVEHFFSDAGGVVGLNLFYRQIDDKIETQTALNADTGRFEEKPVNSGEGMLKGLELDFQSRMALIGLPRLNLRGNATFLDSEVTDPVTGAKRPIKEQPGSVFNIGFDYDISS